MKPTTRQQVKGVMEEWIESQEPKLRSLNADDIRQKYPFHQLIFSLDALMSARAERSIVTSMGAELYPSIAVELGRDRFRNVVTEHAVEGEVSEAACNMIEQIITELREPSRPGTYRRTPNRADELNAILNLREGNLTQRSVIADLYIEDFEDGPLFIEFKTPLPNLDIAAESKKKMLYFLAIMDSQNVHGAKAFLGLTYNPFVTRARYRHRFTNRIMDMDHEVLIGSELWDYLGGPGAYNELLEIVAEINSDAT